MGQARLTVKQFICLSHLALKTSRGETSVREYPLKKKKKQSHRCRKTYGYGEKAGMGGQG